MFKIFRKESVVEYCIVDFKGEIIADGFKTHKDALEFKKQMNLKFINQNKIELKVKGEN